MTYLAEREGLSEARLAEFVDALEDLESVQQLDELCIYVTGSFARGEGSIHSDLDLFFLHRGSSETDALPRLDKTLLDADIVRLQRKLGFPEFSGDGQYLEVHYLEDMISHLGSPRDDFQNLFTARLLMLLESRPVANTETHSSALNEIVNTYFRDYHDHGRTFLPIFLLNDVQRFWKTLCLNYEHKRNRTGPLQAERNANHLRNLKLKFSRLLTCQSMVLALAGFEGPPVGPDMVLELCKMRPQVRLSDLAVRRPTVVTRVEEALELYSWFLEATDLAKEEAEDWIGDQSNRNQAFTYARDFGEILFDVLLDVGDRTDTMRFLVV